MTNKNKGSQKAAQKTHTKNHTSNDLFCAWHGQAESINPSRLNRHVKRSWKRGRR